MDLADTLPWLWCATALVAAGRAWPRARQPAVPVWWLAAAVALLLASLHLWGWNQPIYLAGKHLVGALGVYDQRLWLKVAIGLVFFPMVGWLAWRAWRWTAGAPTGLRAALAAMFADACYVAIRSLSVDGWMPVWIGVEPGKSRFGAALAGVALVAVVATCRRTRREGTDGAG